MLELLRFCRVCHTRITSVLSGFVCLCLVAICHRCRLEGIMQWAENSNRLQKDRLPHTGHEIAGRLKQKKISMKKH